MGIPQVKILWQFLPRGDDDREKIFPAAKGGDKFLGLIPGNLPPG